MLEPLADRVEPWYGGAAAVVRDVPVDHDRQVQPRPGAAEAGRPADRPDAAGQEVEARRCGRDVDGRDVRLCRAAHPGDGVDPVEHAPHPAVRLGDVGGQVVREQNGRPVGTEQASGDLHAEWLQDRQVEVVGSTGELQRRLGAERLRVALVDGAVEGAEVVQPAHDVAAAVTPGEPRVPAGGEDDVAPGRAQLPRDLNSRRRGTHHEHTTGLDRPRTLVAQGVDLGDVRRKSRRAPRGGGVVVVAGGDDDALGTPGPAVGDDHEPARGI